MNKGQKEKKREQRGGENKRARIMQEGSKKARGKREQ